MKLKISNKIDLWTRHYYPARTKGSKLSFALLYLFVISSISSSIFIVNNQHSLKVIEINSSTDPHNLEKSNISQQKHFAVVSQLSAANLNLISIQGKLETIKANDKKSREMLLDLLKQLTSLEETLHSKRIDLTHDKKVSLQNYEEAISNISKLRQQTFESYNEIASEKVIAPNFEKLSYNNLPEPSKETIEKIIEVEKIVYVEKQVNLPKETKEVKKVKEVEKEEETRTPSSTKPTEIKEAKQLSHETLDLINKDFKMYEKLPVTLNNGYKIVSQTAHMTLYNQTLMKISKMYYNTHQKWRLIVDANPMIDPNSIREGQKLIIPNVEIEEVIWTEDGKMLPKNLKAFEEFKAL